MPVIEPPGWSGFGRASSCAWVPGCCAPVAALSPHADRATAQDSAQATTTSFGVMDMRASAMQDADHAPALHLRPPRADKTRVGNECVLTCRYTGSRDHNNKKNTQLL